MQQADYTGKIPDQEFGYIHPIIDQSNQRKTATIKKQKGETNPECRVIF